MANFEDLIDPEYGLQEDEFSLTRPRFGERGHLQVIGWSGRLCGAKRYILKCEKCSEDGELFGDGLFKTLKGHLLTGRVPCGCAKLVKWTDAQFVIRCSRKAEELGFKFLGFEGAFKGSSTKLKMFCDKHGKWNSGNVNDLLSRSCGCPSCRTEKIIAGYPKSDEIMINSFHKSGGFHSDTKFWRSERKSRQGWGVYWWMSCPICGTVGEATSVHLQDGKRPCACSPNRQKEAYINYIVEDNLDTPLALKFGIANKSDRRISNQSRGCIYDVKNFGIWEFPDKQSCLAAERECKQTLKCSILTKEEMHDGWTETTYIFNLEKIIAIYEKHGGVKVENA